MVGTVLYTLASHPRLFRWAANWVFLMLKLVGPQVLEFADRSIYPHPRLALRGAPSFQQMDFDASLGFLVHLILHPDPQGPLPGQSRDLEDQGIGNHLEVTAATEDHFTVEELVLVDIIEEIMRQLVQDPDIRIVLHIEMKPHPGPLRRPLQQDGTFLILSIKGPMLSERELQEGFRQLHTDPRTTVYARSTDNNYARDSRHHQDRSAPPITLRIEVKITFQGW